MSRIKQFYSSLAADYDSMSCMTERMEREAKTFESLVKRYGIKSALDAGAGTGVHSILLARSGVRVTAADISGEMIEQLRQNRDDYGVQLKTVVADFLNLNKLLPGDFNAVFCLGNTLVHLLSREDIRNALLNFYQLLSDNGVLIIQILNYEKILNERKKIQQIRKNDGILYIRYYEYCNNQIIFNVIKLYEAGESLEHTVHSVEINPITRSRLIPILKQIEFEDVQVYGSLNLDEYHPDNSNNLTVIARK